MIKAYTAAKIFTANSWLQHHSILADGNKVVDVIPSAELPADVEIVDFGGHSIIPAFIDLQLYGAGGKLLSAYPEVDSLYRLYEHCFNSGTHYCMPTVATNTYQVFCKCIDTIKQYWAEGGKGILGLHVEGPWINPAKRGAHIKELIHQPNLEQVTELLEYGKGVIKMITLAAEVCSKDVVALIQSYGVVVSAGHSDATFQQATLAFDNGINAATHLFNAMSPLQHRAPGLAGAIMHHPKVMSSIIPDGYHVNFEVVAIAKKTMGDRLFMITDAVTETAVGPYPHHLDGDKYIANGILSGSALTMLKGVQNCINKIGIDKDEALRMAGTYPAKVMGLSDQLGVIKTGAKTEWLVVDDDLNIIDHVTCK